MMIVMMRVTSTPNAMSRREPEQDRGRRARAGAARRLSRRRSDVRLGSILGSLRCSAISRLPETTDEADADEVDEQGDREEQKADGEEGVVLQRPDPGVAECCVRDEPGHGLALLEGTGDDASLIAGGDRDDHRLPDGARDAEHHGRDDAGECGGEDDPESGLHPIGAECGGTLAQRVGNGRHRVLGDGRDGGDDHDAHDQTRGQHAEGSRREVEPLAEHRRLDELQGEEPVDDGRYAGEDLEDWLEHLAHPGTRVLGEEDRGAESEGDGDEERDEGRPERSP